MIVTAIDEIAIAIKELASKYPGSTYYKEEKLCSATIKIGYATFSLRYTEYYKNIYFLAFSVIPPMKQRGYGGKALKALCKWADKHKLAIDLHVSPSNPKEFKLENLVKFYEKYGFKKTINLKIITPLAIPLTREPQ